MARLRSLVTHIGCVAFSIGIGASADVVTTTSETLHGEVELDVLALTTNRGRVEIPDESIRTLTVFSGTTECGVELVDGTRIVGNLSEADLRVKAGLVTRVIPWRDVKSIAFGPAGVDAASIGSGFINLDRYNTSASGEHPLETCPLRLEVDARPYLLGKKHHHPEQPILRLRWRLARQPSTHRPPQADRGPVGAARRDCHGRT